MEQDPLEEVPWLEEAEDIAPRQIVEMRRAVTEETWVALVLEEGLAEREA